MSARKLHVRRTTSRPTVNLISVFVPACTQTSPPQKKPLYRIQKKRERPSAFPSQHPHDATPHVREPRSFAFRALLPSEHHTIPSDALKKRPQQHPNRTSPPRVLTALHPPTVRSHPHRAPAPRASAPSRSPVYRRHAPGTDVRPARKRALYYRAWPVCMLPRGACRCYAGSGRRRAFFARSRRRYCIGREKKLLEAPSATSRVLFQRPIARVPIRGVTRRWMRRTDGRQRRDTVRRMRRGAAHLRRRDMFLLSAVWRVVLTFPSPSPPLSPPRLPSSVADAHIMVLLQYAASQVGPKPGPRTLAPRHRRPTPVSPAFRTPPRTPLIIFFLGTSFFLKISSSQHRSFLQLGGSVFRRWLVFPSA